MSVVLFDVILIIVSLVSRMDGKEKVSCTGSHDKRDVPWWKPVMDLHYKEIDHVPVDKHIMLMA